MIEEYFEATWKVYPRKVNKVQAKQAYAKKFIGTTDEEAKVLARKIYEMLKRQIRVWQAERRAVMYIPHFATWINANVENGKKKKEKAK